MDNNKAHLYAYAVTFFFMYAAVAALFPFFPLVLQGKGFNPSQVGFLMGSYDLISIIGLMIIGHFYDKIRSPRSTIIIIGLISIFILYFLTSTSNTILLIALTMLLGFFVKSPSSLLDALYGLTMPDPQKTYGKIRVSGSLGFLLTALFIQFTFWIQGSRPQSVFTGYTLFLGITLVVTLFLPSQYVETDNIKTERIGFLASMRSFPKVFWFGLLIAFLSSLSLSGHYTFFSLLLRNKFSIENVSGFWAIGPIFEIPLFFFSSHLLNKYKLRTLWIVSLIAGIARMQVYSISTSLLPLYFIQIVHSLAFGLNHLCMISLITKKTSPQSRGFAMSIYMAIGMGLSMFTGGILGGIILHYSDFTLLFQIFSIFPLIAILLTMVYLKD